MVEKNIVPNLEAKASDGNPIFTPRQWLERFRQFTIREHKIDITPLVKGEDFTEIGWTKKEATIQEGLIWEVGPEALYQITRAEYKTEPDSIKFKDLIRLNTEHTTSQNEIHTATGEISSRHKNQKMKHRKKNKKNTKPEALITTKEKQITKKEPLQEWRNSGQDRKQE